MKRIVKHAALLGAASALLLLSGCGSDDDKEMTAATHGYVVTVTNLTAGQPFAPAGVILHGAGYHAFMVGEPASAGIEKMAEGGDLTVLLADADAAATVKATEPWSGIILPGAHESITVESLGETALSVVAMLVNTNDAFVALDASDISGMAVGEMREFSLNAYDAGSENNSETAVTIPGPAGNGEGYNAARDDTADRVTLHPGVLTADEGLSTSALNSLHKWDNPAATVSIVRTR